MGLFVAMLIGLGMGVGARVVLTARDPGGVFLSGLLGIAGSVTAWVLGRSLGWYAPHEDAGILASILGAAGVLALHRLVVRLSA